MSSRESNEQGRSGRRGAEASGERGTGDQPRQGSQRVEVPGEPEPKHHFPPGQAPSEQGEGKPGPEKIAKSQQGMAGAGTGGTGSGKANRGESEQRAEEGPPGGDHTRHGRQQTPGDRQET